MSAPMHGFFGSASTDEGIEADETMYPMDDVINHKRQKVRSTIPKQALNTVVSLDIESCWSVSSVIAIGV